MKRLMRAARRRLRHGTDIVRIERIAATLRFGEHFVERLLLPEERAVRSLAPAGVSGDALAAKEAIASAPGSRSVWVVRGSPCRAPEVILGARPRRLRARRR